MRIAITPAKLSDLGEIGAVYHPKVFKALVVQLCRSPALTLRDEATGKVTAICGLYPEPGHGEAWLLMAPGIAGTPAAAATIRALIGIVRSLPPQIRVVVRVQIGNAKGERIAQILGMAPIGKTAIAGFEMTVFEAGGNP